MSAADGDAGHDSPAVAHAWSGVLSSLMGGDLLPRALRHRKASIATVANLNSAARGQLLIEACEVRGVITLRRRACAMRFARPRAGRSAAAFNS